jgi:hypothetical protein
VIETKPIHQPTGNVRISKDCFRVWSRHDAKGLANFKAGLKQRGLKLIVRVPVARQRWPEPTVG